MALKEMVMHPILKKPSLANYPVSNLPLGEGGRERGWAAAAMGPEGNRLSEHISVKF